MFRSWMMLGFEANQVVGLRVTRMMLGGASARREAKLMVTEKMEAALEANTRMMTGASADEIIRMSASRRCQRQAANQTYLGWVCAQAKRTQT
jgi:hypothetical protein